MVSTLALNRIDISLDGIIMTAIYVIEFNELINNLLWKNCLDYGGCHLNSMAKPLTVIRDIMYCCGTIYTAIYTGKEVATEVNVYYVSLCQAQTRLLTLALKPRGDVTISPK